MRPLSNSPEGEHWQSGIGNNALGISFRRQFINKDNIVDFFSLEYKLIVKVNGGYHSQPEQMVLDKQRTTEIEALGFKVIRFSNKEVLFNTTEAIKTIKKYITNANNYQNQ